MFAPDFFLRLPPSAALIVLSALFSTARGNAIPQQTKTVAYTELDVLPWPLPTPMPEDGDGGYSNHNLLLRQLNTVCGYIDGDPDLPATCSAGSHCAVDVDHGAIGCCPDIGGCTAGLYTGCVDRNSEPQTEINPYVFTCGGGDVCYQNNFAGGFFQYGCGANSNLAATVVLTASNRLSIALSSVAVDLTAEPTSLAEPTTIGTRDETTETETETETDSDSSTTQNTRTTRTTTSDESRTTSDSSSTSEPTSTSTQEPDAPENDDDGGTNVGAIVGGTIGGVAFLALLGVLVLYLLRRRKGNMREGPQNQGKQYIGPEDEGNGRSFEPLPTVQDVRNSQLPRDVPQAYAGAGDYMATDTFDDNNINNHNRHAVEPYASSQSPYAYTSAQYNNSGNSHAVIGGAMTTDHDWQPLTAQDNHGHSHYNQNFPDELPPDPSTNYHGALRAIREEGRESPIIPGFTETSGPYIPRRDGGGGLWQHNRGATSQTRNPVWL